MIRWLVLTVRACCKPKAQLVAENLCLRQQLVVFKRRQQRPNLRNADRRFWILAQRWFTGWQEALILVKPDTVLHWHRKGWKNYWRWRSRRWVGAGRRRIEPELRALIRRMAQENPLWGQRRIQAELARLGFKVCARTVAKYMRRPYNGVPSPGWRHFLTQHTQEIWACDLFTVQTLWFRTLYVFFVIHHGTCEIVHVRVTAHPTADWLAQQMVEACGERESPRYLIRDRDCCYGVAFDRRVGGLRIKQIRTPVKAPRANAIAERWIRSVRTECLDHVFIFGHQQLQRSLNEYCSYYNRWRPHQSLHQTSPCAPSIDVINSSSRPIVAQPVLGGLHHVYKFAA